MKKYYYLRNAQNDVIAIADSTGTVVARYYYDAWGKLLRVTDGAGNAVTDESHVGVVNPIRYRGYYYDSETGYYLTGSRYYDPTVGRFINADGQINTSQGILGCNMYAYCLNNPVNMVGHDGRKPGDLFDTMDEAVKDFANYINAQSISENLEYGSFMYSVKTTVKTYQTVTTTHRFLWWTWTSTSTKTIKTTKIQYSYVAPKKGKPAGVSIPVNWFGAKKKVAELHTHAAYDPKYDNDIFSPGDLNKWINYVATPLGTVRKYDPKNPSSERDKAIEIYNDIPWDSNHPSR